MLIIKYCRGMYNVLHEAAASFSRILRMTPVSADFRAKLDRSKLHQQTAYLYIPKFKISSTLQFQDHLKELGRFLKYISLEYK
jgi:hypothetical protein